jgi:hypothetical protein
MQNKKKLPLMESITGTMPILPEPCLFYRNHAYFLSQNFPHAYRTCKSQYCFQLYA